MELFAEKTNCPECKQEMEKLFMTENNKKFTTGYKCLKCNRNYSVLKNEVSINWIHKTIYILICKEANTSVQYVINEFSFDDVNFISKAKYNQIIQFNSNDYVKLCLIDILYSYYRFINQENKILN